MILMMLITRRLKSGKITKNHHFADQQFHTKSHGASRDGRDGSAGGKPCTWRGRGGLMATPQGTQGPNRQEWPGERRGKSPIDGDVDSML